LDRTARLNETFWDDLTYDEGKLPATVARHAAFAEFTVLWTQMTKSGLACGRDTDSVALASATLSALTEKMMTLIPDVRPFICDSAASTKDHAAVQQVETDITAQLDGWRAWAETLQRESMTL
jgi:hypothetical protein